MEVYNFKGLWSNDNVRIAPTNYAETAENVITQKGVILPRLSMTRLTNRIVNSTHKMVEFDGSKSKNPVLIAVTSGMIEVLPAGGNLKLRLYVIRRR